MRTALAITLALALAACGGNTILTEIDIPTTGVAFLAEPSSVPVAHLKGRCPTDIARHAGNYTTEEDPLEAGQYVINPNITGWHCYYLNSIDAEAHGLQPWAWEVFVPDGTIVIPENGVIRAYPAVVQ